MSLIEPPTRGATREFTRTGTAAPSTVVEWRGEFGDWLRREFTFDDERFSDIVLAVDEALSNAAEFAYSGACGGPMVLVARYCPTDRHLAVTVSDDGRWHERDGEPRILSRGRGIALMKALADEFAIDRNDGTQVRLLFGYAP